MSYPATSSLAADPRVARGMEAQLERRSQRLRGGDRSLGWKLGFGAPAAKDKLAISAPLVGCLFGSGRLDPGAVVAIGRFANPALEPEVAVHLARDLPPGADHDTICDAIGGMGPAFELADVEPPPEDVEEILRGNIFQRGCMLGSASPRRSLQGVSGRVVENDAEPQIVENPERLTGEMVGLLRHVADLLDAFGERLSAGEVVITGSIVPPLSVAPGDRVEYELNPLGRLSIAFES
jgi:2-keto-4-pentenoate hydratase